MCIIFFFDIKIGCWDGPRLYLLLGSEYREQNVECASKAGTRQVSEVKPRLGFRDGGHEGAQGEVR